MEVLKDNSLKLYSVVDEGVLSSNVSFGAMAILFHEYN